MTKDEELDFYKKGLETSVDFYTKELHPQYGPCDALGNKGECSMCAETIKELKKHFNLAFVEQDNIMKSQDCLQRAESNLRSADLSSNAEFKMAYSKVAMSWIALATAQLQVEAFEMQKEMMGKQN